MNWVTGIVVYFLIWWVVIFAVLPWGVERDQGGPEVTGPGAPAIPRIKEKFLATTFISAVIWGIIALLIESDLISFRDWAANS